MLSQFAVLTTRMQDFWKRAMYLNLLSTRTVNSQIYVRHLNIQIQRENQAHQDNHIIQKREYRKS